MSTIPPSKWLVPSKPGSPHASAELPSGHALEHSDPVFEEKERAEALLVELQAELQLALHAHDIESERNYREAGRLDAQVGLLVQPRRSPSGLLTGFGP